ncbi:MAG: adenylate/guanylate cyclase domain-containing protein [Betaproteobacteria bacterium]|nr:adenylate/guanylate cyclase domain-containing protein [Betaproteobacteria bacterium]
MSERHTTVLFADVSESTKIYETAGDSAAHEAIDRCLALLRQATQAAGGRVVKTIGDEVMSVFARADAAAAAAAEMQGGVDHLPPVAGLKLALRIGFHAGPVIQKESDVFGDTVNLASRLAEQAGRGQIITSAETAAILGPMFRGALRDLYAIPVKGKAEPVALCELLWRRDDDATVFSTSTPGLQAPAAPLRLKYHATEILRRRDNDSVVIGREAGCGLVIADPKASRRHCTVERRGDKWVIQDHSTNGTYVSVEGDTELLLRREELTLRKRGWIACGQPRAGTQDAVQFWCE